jgi:hypothetical protein
MKRNVLSLLFGFLLIGSVCPLPASAVNPPPEGCYSGYTTAAGCNALQSLTIGLGNTGIGWYSLFTDSIGSYNTALGAGTLAINNSIFNTATGAGAMLLNTFGFENTANGAAALLNNNGDFNTAIGAQALFSNTDGASNNAIGYNALSNNTTGSFNIAMGDSAGSNIATANNVICIGANVAGDDVSNRCYIGQIFGVTSSGGTAVFINSSGQLGTITSSRRFKEEIKPMNEASEALLALKPVTFRYKKAIDPEGTPQFGLVAEDVEKVNPDLVLPDKEGKPYTVRYEAVNAMLLNEFLKEHRKVEQLEKQVQVLTAGLQKVSAQLAVASPSGGGLDLSKAAPRTIVDDK